MAKIVFSPELPEPSLKTLRARCSRLARALKECASDGKTTQQEIARFREDLRSIGAHASIDELKLLVSLNVIADLVASGWTLGIVRSGIRLSFDDSKEMRSKDYVRERHLLERDAQLQEASVREFICGMERRRLTPRGWHSIFSVMRDGRALANELSCISKLDDSAARSARLAEVIQPYLQFVRTDELCPHTGLLLSDIWRYFRHTWVTAYRSVPGRSMMILVRDAAAPNHPVIGIAALGSAVVQQSVRDAWIGWDSSGALQRLLLLSPQRLTKWTFQQVEEYVGGIYTRDLIRRGLLARREITTPTPDTVKRLRDASIEAMAEHRNHPEKSVHKTVKDESRMSLADWQTRAETSLFRAKRCQLLGDLLEIRHILNEAFAGACTHRDHENVLARRDVQAAISRLCRLAKGERVGIYIMDVTVCGAVAPYNALLGGKLACLLLCSPEVGKEYADRYGSQPSLIASCMKGAPVIRQPRLLVLGTTSLYGQNSSQYNRLKIPADLVGGKAGDTVAYRELGLSVGYGSFHLSTETVDVMSVLLGRVSGGRRVNSIFGEGVNPLMRKIREALDFVGMPSEDILRHGNQRIVYGVALASNIQDVFLGLDKNPKYLLPQADAREMTQRIASFWRERWLSPRILRPDITEQVAAHTLDFPVTHGARVTLPLDDFDEQFSLFH